MRAVNGSFCLVIGGCFHFAISSPDPSPPPRSDLETVLPSRKIGDFDRTEWREGGREETQTPHQIF